jgi:hypothetical protein
VLTSGSRNAAGVLFLANPLLAQEAKTAKVRFTSASLDGALQTGCQCMQHLSRHKSETHPIILLTSWPVAV